MKERKSLTELANETVSPQQPPAPAVERTPSFSGASLMQARRPTAMAERETILEVDAKRCRPWKHHNRHASWYTPERCEDLIISIPRDGQKMPGCVRRLNGDPDFDYEVIYGMRRCYACNYTDTKFRVKITEGDDRECAKLQHLENADKEDISPMERARSFRDHLKQKLFESQDQLAETLHLKKSLLSQQLSAAEIFDYTNIERLFPLPQEIPMKSAYKLSLLLKGDQTKGLVLKAAENLVKANAPENKSASAILKLLLNATERSSRVKVFEETFNLGERAKVDVSRNEQGKVVLALTKGVADTSRESFVEVMGRIYDSLAKSES